jgi:predicted XRE-type DNA-binding protein
MSPHRFASVWDAIEDTPQQAENMKLRYALMMALKTPIVHAGMSQAQDAELLGVTQPRVSDLMRGKINLFGLDALANMAAAAGLARRDAGARSRVERATEAMDAQNRP